MRRLGPRRIAIMAALVFVVTLVIAWRTGGTRDREVIGIWESPTCVFHFDEDGNWGGAQRTDPTFENQSGNWRSRGDRVRVSFSAIDDAPEGELVLILDSEGYLLAGTDEGRQKASDWKDWGVLTKRDPDRSASSPDPSPSSR